MSSWNLSKNHSREVSRIVMVGVLSAAMLTWIGCGEPNPLIGRWQLDTRESTGIAGVGAVLDRDLGGLEEIEFRKDKIVLDNRSETVSYEVTDGRVIVTDSSGRGTVYQIVGKDRIVLEKSTGKVTLVRVPPTVATAAE